MPKKKPSWIKDQAVRKSLPKGCKLPKKFEAFIAAEPKLPIDWESLEPLGLKPAAMQEVLPFMRTLTGGLVSFWYHAAEPAVVYFGDEGELDVLALNFDEFLKGAVLGKSGVHDLDSSEPRLQMPAVTGEPLQAGLDALQIKFAAWWKQNKALLDGQTDLEDLRERVHAVAKKMIAEGKSKVYKLGSKYWSMQFQIERTREGIAVTYLDYGKYYPVPKEYDFVLLVEKLLAHTKNQNKAQYDLLVTDSGIVSIDRDRELVLMSAQLKAELAETRQRKQVRNG